MFTVLGFSGFTMNYPQKLELFAGDQATQIHLTMNEQMLGAWVTLGCNPEIISGLVTKEKSSGIF